MLPQYTAPGQLRQEGAQHHARRQQHAGGGLLLRERCRLRDSLGKQREGDHVHDVCQVPAHQLRAIGQHACAQLRHERHRQPHAAARQRSRQQLAHDVVSQRAVPAQQQEAGVQCQCVQVLQ